MSSSAIFTGMRRYTHGWRLVYVMQAMLIAAALAITVLALSVARGSLSTSLRVPDPQRTYFFGRGPGALPVMSTSEALAALARRDLFNRVAAFQTGTTVVNGSATYTSAAVAWVTPGMVAFLPREMRRGRPLLSSDFGQRGAEADHNWEGTNVLVSQRLLRELGGERWFGRPLQTSAGTFRVVGVLPAWSRFPYPSQPDLIVPLADPVGVFAGYYLLGELRPGITPARAIAEIKLGPGAPARMAPVQASLDPLATRASVVGLALALMIILLLIATVAQLGLLGSLQRRRGLAVRLLLGAPPRGLMAEVMGGAVWVGLCGAAAAALLVRASAPLAMRVAGQAPIMHPDRLTLLCAAGVLLAACLAAALPAALQLRGCRALAAVREESGAPTRFGSRSRLLVLAVQVAVSFALGLSVARLAANVYRLATEPLGISTQGIWEGSLRLPLADRRVQPQHVQALEQQLLSRLQSLPGVAGVAFSSGSPGSAGHLQTRALTPLGAAPAAADTAEFVTATTVSPGYLALMGSHLLRGRYFTAQDRAPSQFDASPDRGPVIISEPLARVLFGAADPIGRRISRRSRIAGSFNTVVGVVSGIRTLGLDRPLTPELFQPLDQGFFPPTITIKMQRSAPMGLVEVQPAITAVLPGAYIADFGSVADKLDTELREPRAQLSTLALLAILAACVAAFGLASVLLLIVRERDREIGVRLALGGSRPQIALNLVRRVLPWVGVGAILGLGCAAALWASLGASLAGKTGATPALAACFALALVLMASTWIPLRRAFRLPVDRLLRSE